MILKGLFSTDHPVLAHVVPMRRCNLKCTYCNEYDTDAHPVPIESCWAASTGSPNWARP